MADRFKIKFAVNIIPRRGNEVLLALRQNTGWRDGDYHLVGGHVDGGEPAEEALVREVLEEIGIMPDIDSLKLVAVTHRLNDAPENEYASLYFETQKWTGEVENKEPEKCAELAWFNIHDLPKNIAPHVSRLLEGYDEGLRYFSTKGTAA